MKRSRRYRQSVAWASSGFPLFEDLLKKRNCISQLVVGNRRNLSPELCDLSGMTAPNFSAGRCSNRVFFILSYAFPSMGCQYPTQKKIEDSAGVVFERVMKYSLLAALPCFLLCSICLRAQQATNSKIPTDKRIAKRDGTAPQVKTDKPGEREQATPNMTPPVPNHETPEQAKSDADQARENIEIQEKLVTATDWLAVLGALQIAVLIVQATVYFGTLRTLNKQTEATKVAADAARDGAKAARENAELAIRNTELLIEKERPRITVTVDDLDLAPSSPEFLAVSYKVECLCPTHAVIVEAHAGTYTFSSMKPTIELTAPIDGLPGIVSRTATFEKTALIRQVFDPELILQIKIGEFAVYFRGFIKYRGVHLANEDTPYITSFRYKWVSKPSSIPGIDNSRWEKSGDPQDNRET